MSESATQQERETEVVAGTIGGITQKKADTWTVQVTPEGSQYAKNLWTKDVELVESLQSKFGQVGAFVGGLGAPYMVNGKEVRSWWIRGMVEAESGDGTARSPITQAEVTQAQKKVQNANPGQAARSTASGNEMTKEEWARKDSAIHKMACIKTAADALKHTLPSDPSPEDLTQFLTRVTTLTMAWHRSVIAERDDPTGEDLPF